MLQRRFQQQVLNHFHTALDARDTSIKYLGLLQNGHGIDISRLLMATSLCSDDINIPSTSFFNVVLGPFFLGGLGGLPFVGKTGMTAFAHHVPDGGTAFIFYGPHIGITLKGELGKMYRPRQEEPGASCGAISLAVSRLANADYKPDIQHDDFQQSRLESLLLPYREEILAAPTPMLKATECTYQLIDEQLHELLHATKSEFKVDRVALLGGIVINTDYGIDDYFDVHNFEVIQLRHL